jgi:hypothetical protein
LCKSLNTPLIASETFEAHHQGDLTPLGRHQLAGVSSSMEVFTLPERTPPA